MICRFVFVALSLASLSGCQQGSLPPCPESEKISPDELATAIAVESGPVDPFLTTESAVRASASSDLSQLALNILAWNVESGASNPKVIASQLAKYPGLDLVVLTEVLPSEFENFCSAIQAGVGDGLASVNSQSGDEDRVEVIYNRSRLELLKSDEPTEMAGVAVNTGRHRSPLVCLFQDRKGGERFYVVAVHLARGNAEFRKQQAIAIREWARDRQEAVILIGDLNFDFVFADDRGNEAFEELQRDNILQWVRPVELIDSNWYDADGDGLDDFPDSLLDGAYVSGPAREWNAESRILVREGDFPDDAETSDHRPLTLRLVPEFLADDK